MPDPELIESPLSQRLTVDDVIVDVEIYALEGTEGWVLEVIDADNTSTVWDDLFSTDQAAFDELNRTIRQAGILSIVGPEA